MNNLLDDFCRPNTKLVSTNECHFGVGNYEGVLEVGPSSQDELMHKSIW